MKTRHLFSFLALAGCACGFGIDWYTIDGGGGTSAGGTYTLQGTTGQPDAGVMSGGTYTLQGGYWSAPEMIQVTGGPALTLTVKPGGFLLQWPAPSTGWHLEKSGDLQSWSPETATVTVSGGTNQVTVSHTQASQFYRLRNP
jgi:hypothetical protein